MAIDTTAIAAAASANVRRLVMVAHVVMPCSIAPGMRGENAQ
jgi:hypothetical protein